MRWCIPSPFHDGEWRIWFAWRPVQTYDGTWVWWELVWRTPIPTIYAWRYALEAPRDRYET